MVEQGSAPDARLRATRRAGPAFSIALFAALCMGAGCAAHEDDESGAPSELDDLTAERASCGPAGGLDGGTGTPPRVRIDRSGLTDVGVDAGLDYADPRMWLCRPGNDPDECDANLDATELKPNGARVRDVHKKAKNPEVDCFYVYPTVKLTSPGPMTDFANVGIVRDALLGQGARFSEVCRVYAPLYRQNGVVPSANGAPSVPPPSATPTPAPGLQDVRDAFAYYLKNLNQGRKVVLLGHSQGTGMLTAMMARDVDPNPEVRAKLLSALLIGGSIAVPEGKDIGGTFKNIPVCTKAGQVGCVIAYVSYTKEMPPSATVPSAFGRDPAPGQVAACTDPAVLSGRMGRRYRGSYVMIKKTNPSLNEPDGLAAAAEGVKTPFLLYRDVFRGACKRAAPYNYLEISLELPEGDRRPAPPYRFPKIEAALGLHLLDYALEMDDLIDAVRLQIKAAR